MATKQVNAINACKKCINEHKSFVLQGGAGSGKTESLKELLIYIEQTQPEAKVICITHTNAAVDEILMRIGERHTVSTIHSFLHNLIKDYKKNIKCVISDLFLIPQMVRGEQEDNITETDYKKQEHERYKKIYEKYAEKLYTIKHENCQKVIGKREYDINPQKYNEMLNEAIEELNVTIKQIIEERDYSKIYYNETSFNSLKELSYGHDGLLSIFHLLIAKYPILSKMIADRYDYIFIDEYQDTQADVLVDLMGISERYKLTIGLFGDSMQSIYQDGIGDVDCFVEKSMLVSIPKPDNFRCSYEVISVINSLRIDDIKQSVALKQLKNGKYETEVDRHGSAQVLYCVYDEKPTSRSSSEDKKKYQDTIDLMINEAKKYCENPKVLMLTNKAIAEKNGFKRLYKIFDERYLDVKDRMDNYLRIIQVLDACDVCNLYLKKDYNNLIKQIRKGGYTIRNVSDKEKISDIIEDIINDENLSMWEAVNKMIDSKLLKQTEMCKTILNGNSNFVEQIKHDELYQQFKIEYNAGKNTFTRIKESISITTKEEFEHYKMILLKEHFLKELFSKDLKFVECLNYLKYIEEETEYITMHKTKGTSIPSVIVVMEEYYWNDYDFSLLYLPDVEKKVAKRINSQKLIYVACSRAQQSLVCIKILQENEEKEFLKFFPNAQRVSFDDNIEN